MSGGAAAQPPGGGAGPEDATQVRPPRGSEPAIVDGFPLWLATNYRRDRRLGKGGMGVVYRYRDTKLDRLVAVKALPAGFSENTERRERFLHEARVLASLDHANVAKIHAAVEHDGADFLVLEFVGGETLARRLFRGPLDLASAVSVALQVGRAIEAGHALDVIHRDVKPANIMVTPDGVAKLLDYGLARAHAGPDLEATTAPPRGDDPTVAFRTRRGQIMGTAGYMSPEQASGQPSDHRTDIWAFGCVLFECLAGSAAFGGRSSDERIRATLEETPPFDELPDSTPDPVTNLIRRCLARPAGGRWRSMRPVCRALEESIRRLESRRGEQDIPNNLPALLTTFIPRAGEIDRLRELLAQRRLVTLVGLGGAGKTRLALEVASELIASRTARPDGYDDGIWLVELASIADPELIPQIVAATLPGRPGASGEADRPTVDAVVEMLGDRKMLLVLDNCEHVIEACGRLVTAILRRCTGVEVLVTSREGLHVPGEQIYKVPELAFPSGAVPGDIAAYEAVRLFAERASLVRPDFDLAANADAVAAICSRLEGVPLAIELAAARVSALAVPRIAERLFEVLDPARVLGSSIDWSIGLLSDDERALLGRLSLFRGGWTLEAAEAVCGDADGAIGGRAVIELLGQLVEKSLVVYDEQRNRARYRLLETVRQYAARQLSDSGRDRRRRHAAFFLDLAGEADEHFSSQDQAAWLDRLEIEHDNIRAALDTCDAEEGDPVSLARFAVCLHMFWCVRGFVDEGRRWLEAAIVRRGGAEDVLAMQTLNAAGIVSVRQGDHAAAGAHYRRALVVAQGSGDRLRAAGILTNLGSLKQAERQLDESRRYHEESLAEYEVLGNEVGVAMARLNLADVRKCQGAEADARDLLEACLPVFRRLGDQQRIAAALHNLGEIAMRFETGDRAESLFRESLDIRRELRDRKVAARTVLWLALIARYRGEHERTARLLGGVDTLIREIGDHLSGDDAVTCERCRQGVAEHLDEPVRAAVWDAGASMTFDQLMQYALHDELPDPSTIVGPST